METRLHPRYQETPLGRRAEAILRACVHCGFCTATCPTFQLLGDEQDGPRGRIYLIKQVLEGHAPGRATQLHLDRCLNCRSCETTCPSGVDYGELLDLGRQLVESQVPRPPWQRLQRRLIRAIFPYPARAAALLGLGRLLRPLLPERLRRKIPARQRPGDWPALRSQRRVLLLEGCVQKAATPATDAAAARVLARLGIELTPVAGAGCCGAVDQHLGAEESARAAMRRNIDAWWPQLERGAEAILINASGCAMMVKEYARHLADDPSYAARARRVSELAKDLSELIATEPLETLGLDAGGEPISFHSPCSLQHGQQLNGVVEGILSRVGYQLNPVVNAHLCCGSAGTYSLLQPELSQRLLGDKLAALQSGQPTRIASANIGCQLHLASAAQVPVQHWIELLDELL